jgi:chemotaxis methyl-accepting protein methylase
MNDEDFRKLLQFFDLSWRGYRKVRKGVKKRIVGQMQQLGCRNMEDYLCVLQKDSREIEKAKELLTVSISRFFRDHRLWEVIAGRIIPKLVVDFEASVRVWSAGCACGEEVYSLKMLWDCWGKENPIVPPLEIWATDMNPVVLRKARDGVYSPSSLKGVKEPCLSDYFISVEKGRFAVRDGLKQGILWKLHDLVSEDPLEVTFDLIFLRNNLLTYYEDPLKIPAFSKVVDVLRWGGYLIVGNNEEVPLVDLPLKRSPYHRCIFIKAVS